jgi:hypothetical protein
LNGDKVEGWIDAMRMSHKVDDGAILKKAKAGDQIMATVYDGDLVLHKGNGHAQSHRGLQIEEVSKG